MELAEGIVLRVKDAAYAKKWLCDNLFFTQTDVHTLVNGTCTLYIYDGEANALAEAEKGTYCQGLAHVALAAKDIDAALSYCKGRGLKLQTDNGHSFFNPKVFGDGERYFNILTPFGAVIEIAQRVAQPLDGDKVICGLDHIGVPCADFEKETQLLDEKGFRPLFEPVQNENDKEGRITCVMLCNGALTLEVYSFIDMRAVPMPSGAALCGIMPYSTDAVMPSGLHFMRGEYA